MRFDFPVPYRLRRMFRRALSWVALNYTIWRFKGLRVGERPSRALLRALRFGWDNDSFVADVNYLEAITEFAESVDTPILECGSGISTVLLGLLGKELWSLEHLPEWHRRLDELLKRYKLHSVHLCLAPLIAYDEFDWYALPPDLPQRFALAICDGPPAKTTRGARYGFLPLMKARLAPGALVLMDDADRREEVEILERWQAEATIDTSLKREAKGAYAILRIT